MSVDTAIHVRPSEAISLHHDVAKGLFMARAPANLALIKYMGKTEDAAISGIHQGVNASLSYTLPHLASDVHLQPADQDSWSPLQGEGLVPLSLSEAAQARFLDHMAWLKSQLGFTGCFHVKSGNHFPSDCGLASSSSSFAALTAALVFAVCHIMGRPRLDWVDMARLSRHGSGSSCRSFHMPWVVWSGEQIERPVFPIKQLHHTVVLLDAGKKAVSSREAHRRVQSSALMAGRVARATQRLSSMQSALSAADWPSVCRLAWQEFWDMHALFETAAPAFGYMTADTMAVLQHVRPKVFAAESSCLVTLDAGSNVHILSLLEDRASQDALCAWLDPRYRYITGEVM